MTGGSVEKTEIHPDATDTDAEDPAFVDEARPSSLPCLPAPTRTHKLRPASQSLALLDARPTLAPAPTPSRPHRRPRPDASPVSATSPSQQPRRPRTPFTLVTQLTSPR